MSADGLGADLAEPPGGYTVLRAASGKFATKQWSWNPTLQQWTKRSYSAGAWFIPTEEVAANLDELATSIQRIALNPSAMIIRGALKPEFRERLRRNPNTQMRKMKLEKPGVVPPFIEVPRQWLMADIDNFFLRALDDLVDDPESAIEHALHEILPPEFQDVRCFWQLSSSAGFVEGVLKSHIFFWLDRPLIDRELKAILKQCAPRLVDLSPYQGVQPHYIAAPIIQGGPDPIPRRFGWLQGSRDYVTLPELQPEQPRRQRSSSSAGHRSAGSMGQRSSGGGRGSYAGGSGSVEDALAQLGDGEGLYGFHEPLRTATMRYARQCQRYGSRDDDALKAKLTAAIKAAPCGPARSGVGEYLDEVYQQRLIDGAFALLDGNADNEAVPPHHAAPVGDIVAARQELRDRVGAFMERTTAWWADDEEAPPEHAGIAAVLGAGKSTTARHGLVSWIPQQQAAERPHRVLWLIPTHKLGNEAAEDFAALGLHAAVLRGRDAVDPDADEGTRMCLDREAVTDAVVNGLDVEKSICGSPLNGGKVCAFYHKCGYQRQKARVAQADIIIAAHQALFNTPPKIVTANLGLVVIDESFWQAGLKPNRETRLEGFADTVNRFPPLRDADARYGLGGKKKRRDQDAPPPRMEPDPKATEKLRGWASLLEEALFRIPVDELVDKAAIVATGLTAEDCRDAAKLEWRRQVEVAVWPGMPAKARKEAIAQSGANAGLPRRAGIWKALADLLEGDATHTGRVQMGERGDEPLILLHSRLEIASQLAELPMLLLDASLPETIVRHFLPELKVIARIDASAPHATVTQIKRGWGRNNLLPHPGVSDEENARREGFLAEFRDWMALQSGGNGLLITHKDLLPWFADMPGAATANFNAVRGIDAWKDVRTCVILGRPLPSPPATREMALALTGEAVPVQEPHLEQRGVLMKDGTGRSIPTRVYADPTLEAIRAAVCDAEVMQAIGRCRAVNRTAENPVLIFLATDVVLPSPVTTLVNWADVRPGVGARMAARGVVLTSPADAICCYPDLFPNAKAAEKAISRNDLISATSPYDSLSHKGMSPKYPPIEYRPIGRGQQTRHAWATGEPAQVAEWLAAKLGPLAFCRPAGAPEQPAQPAPAPEPAAEPMPERPKAEPAPPPNPPGGDFDSWAFIARLAALSGRPEVLAPPESHAAVRKATNGVWKQDPAAFPHRRAPAGALTWVDVAPAEP